MKGKWAWLFFSVVLHSKSYAQADSARSARSLEEVIVTGRKADFKIDGDRKVFQVSSSIAAIGGTAVDVIRNIPSLSVDVNGNVQFRGGSPHIFVNDKASDLTLDQIPSGDIERIEILSMPSAKYQASAGGGIINIVLKDKSMLGFSGMLTLGLDRLLGYTAGADFSYATAKWMFSIKTFFPNRKTEAAQTIDRHIYYTTAQQHVGQFTSGTSKTNMAFYLFSPTIKYSINKKTSISLHGRIFLGKFLFEDDSRMETDSTDFLIIDKHPQQRLSNNEGNVFFQMYSIEMDKKLPAEGSKWLTMLRVQQALFSRPTSVKTISQNDGSISLQTTSNDGLNRYAMLSTDLTLPLSKAAKVELGGQADIREISSFSILTKDGQKDENNSTDYNNTEITGGLYATFSQRIAKFNYQLGLRMESSFFAAHIKNKNLSYTIDFPLLLFPSASLQYNIDEKTQIQLLYSYKIDRPNFFQTIPIVDYANPLLIRKGNPNLKPAFIHLAEWNYSTSFPHLKNSSLLFTLYFKNITDMITSYFTKTTNASTQKEEIINTPFNSGNLYNIGLEITPRGVVTNWYEVTPSFNFLWASIQQYNGLQHFNRALFSYFIKINNTFELPHQWRIQLNARYNSRSLVPPNSGSGGQGGGNNRLRPEVSVTAQGYIDEVFELGVGVEKNWKRTFFISCNVNDILATDYKRIVATTDDLYQYQRYLSNPYFVSVNFRYIFGQKQQPMPQKGPQNKHEQPRRNEAAGDLLF